MDKDDQNKNKTTQFFVIAALIVSILALWKTGFFGGSSN